MERRKRNFSLKSRQSRREGEFFPKILKIESRKRIFPSKSHKSRGKREIFFSIFKIESRKRNCSFKSLKSRGERENFLKNPENRDQKVNFFLKLFKILKIERRTRLENTFLQLEREICRSFLFENFSRSRLLSMSAIQLMCTLAS